MSAIEKKRGPGPVVLERKDRGFLIWNEKGEDEDDLVNKIRETEGDERNYIIFTAWERKKLYPSFKGSSHYTYDRADPNLPKELKGAIIIVDQPERLIYNLS